MNNRTKLVEHWYKEKIKEAIKNNNHLDKINYTKMLENCDNLKLKEKDK